MSDQPDVAVSASAKNGDPRVNKLFRACVKNNASDMHLKSDKPPCFRVQGALRVTSGDPISTETLEKLFREIMTEAQWNDFCVNGSTDFAHQVDGNLRYRVNIFRQRGNVAVAARRIPTEILDYDTLHLPPVLKDIASYHQGLVLVAGITGSGKSTTIASMIEQINKTRPCHIITLEDPIEFIFEDKKAIVNQREIGLDVKNFGAALKYLMREDPDVVLIGEMRDQETFEAALHAAESGHLVFGTVHSSNTATTITRVLELFPEEARELVRSSLVFNLQAVVCLKLLKGIRKDVPRIPAVEIMICNATIRKLIGEKREKDTIGVLRNCYQDGMMDFTESLRQLVEQEFISATTAYEAAPNPDELKMRLKGINVGSGGIIG